MSGVAHNYPQNLTINYILIGYKLFTISACITLQAMCKLALVIYIQLETATCKLHAIAQNWMLCHSYANVGNS